MSTNTIENVYITQFTSDVLQLSQQKESKLVGLARRRDKNPGEDLVFNRIGATEVHERVGRFGDVSYIEPEFSTRRVTYKEFEHATLISRQDDMRVLVDTQSEYQVSARRAMGRQYDRTIISALLGDALTGKSGTNTVSLPSAQKIAVGSSRLTRSKLEDAREILLAAEVEMDDLYLLITAKQERDLRAMTETTSQDYTPDYALMDGKVKKFLGFNIVHSERLTLDGNGDRQLIAFAKGAVAVSFKEEMYGSIDQLPQKANDKQVLLSSTFGAVRLEEEQVVEIACDES